MASRLRHIRLTSVDLVRAGANKEADICLFKSLDRAGSREKRSDDLEEIRESNRFDRIREAVHHSSGTQFHAAVARAADTYRTKGDLPHMLIDKSRFTPRERAQYEALIARAVVPENDAEESGWPSRNEPSAPEWQDRQAEGDGSQSDGGDTPPTPELAAALERLHRLEKSIVLRECTEKARAYALLGEDENELASTLYTLKQSDGRSYRAYVAALDKSLALVRKSGLFREIGKSSNRVGGGADTSVTGRIDAEAKAFQQAEPGLSYATAVAKAWEAHPEWVKEYDAECRVW